MTEIPRKYIKDDRNQTVAVQLDIDTFEKIEELLENYGLVELMKQTEGTEKFVAAEAKAFYRTLDKAK
ncbi:MAG: hypothetical protein HY964_07500 [Ignavibacteriales bacterium]|nr:hypothetical protein [Ignavibacteriales bacterium]